MSSISSEKKKMKEIKLENDLKLYHRSKPGYAFSTWFYCEHCCKNLKVTSPERHISNLKCDTCSKRMEFCLLVSDVNKCCDFKI